MKTKSKSYRVITALALAVLMITVTILATSASPNDNHIILESESGIPALYEVEVGATRTKTVANLNQARSGDESLATVAYDNSGLNNVRITGVKAGVVTMAYGTSVGTVIVNRWQVTDSSNISEYIIKDGGEVAFSGPGDSKYAPVEVVVGTNNIKWKSMNTNVASVNNAGLITANASGTSVVIGEFVDKWGAPHTIAILVGVGVDPPGGGDLIQGPDGKWYKPVVRPPNVFEVVDENGNSKNPPEYVYNPDGTPGNGNDRPAIPHPDGSGNFLVEDPIGSNIWKKVGDDGNLVDSPALWGGPDGKPGGGDDKPVTLYGNDYWVSMGQNVWRKVDKANPRGSLGPLTGGGPDHNPATNPVTLIYDNTSRDGKYYVGPFGSGSDTYYYGDPPGGNGLLDSDENGLRADDIVYYVDSNGNLVINKPGPDPGTTLPEIIENAPENSKITDDGGREWYVVRHKTVGTNNYTLLASARNVTGYGVGEKFEPVRFNGNSSLYEGSELQGIMTYFYMNYLSHGLKEIAVIPTLGNNHSSSTVTSEPTNVLAGWSVVGFQKDVAFALSYGDANLWGFGNMSNAYANLHHGTGYPQSYNKVWLRTAHSNNAVWYIDGTTGGNIYSQHPVGEVAYAIAGLWVKTN